MVCGIRFWLGSGRDFDTRRRSTLLATSGPERPGFRKQREREDHATAWSRAGEPTADRVSLGSPWQRSHELEGKKGKFWAWYKKDPVLFLREARLWDAFRFRRVGQKKARQAKPGVGALRFRGSLNWSARSFHDVPRYKVGLALGLLSAWSWKLRSLPHPHASAQERYGTA